MKRSFSPVLLAVGLMLSVSSAWAFDDCAARAAEKKLAGAAKNSFMKKCEADFKATPAFQTCNSTADEKKLRGAARSSFMKKCVADNAAK